MARRYGHIGDAAQREAVDVLARANAETSHSGVGTELGTLREQMEALLDAMLLKELGSLHWTISATG